MKKVRLKYLEESDYSAWYEGFSNRRPSQSSFDDGLLDMSICSKEWFADLVAKHEKFREQDQQYIWAVYDENSGKHVGMFNLVTLARSPLDWAEIGYSIHNQYWRQGYASAALEELKRLSRQLGFHRLEAHVNPQNVASKNLLNKSAFTNEGIRKSFLKEGETWEDKEIFSYILDET
ncbi:GNAT family N-acetyltransferase [Streptococcus massiliensis]|uniref:Acetyltransferase n=1 Tax=Streptococcus massiliensis TaxID=313439 RepID=A0A380KW28_9STRE|nr:GNAT family protein [Streptococcus massiliensis]SUN75895.1 acetyltransferase [Streptococcus massiliensis]